MASVIATFMLYSGSDSIAALKKQAGCCADAPAVCRTLVGTFEGHDIPSALSMI